MYRTRPFLLSTLLILIGISSLSFTAVTQWRRIRSEILYSELTRQRSEQILPEIPAIAQGEALAERSTYVVKDNPNRQWVNINPDFAGWLTIEGTNIDYPLVRSQDNKDYLKLDFYRRRSEAGAIFMDYRNIGHFNDKHTIIYGHNMRNRTMFSQLDVFLSEQFFLKSPPIEVRGLYETKYYRVFAVYAVSADEYTIPVTFDDESYAAYLDSLRELSLHESDAVVNPGLSLLSLVTCSDGIRNGRLIVHAIELRP